MQANNLPVETTTINGTEYEVTVLPYSLGRKLLVRLYKVLAPPLADALAGAPGIDGDTEIDLNSMATMVALAPALSSGLKGLAEHLSEEDLEHAVSVLSKYTKVRKENGIMVPLVGDMEIRFAGNYGEQFEWLWFSLKVNYAGFLKGQRLAALLANAKAASKVKSSPTTSIGKSTESPAVSDIPRG